MVSIGGVSFLLRALLLSKSVYSNTGKLNSITDQPSTVTEPTEAFHAVHWEDFVPKACGDEPTKDGSVKWIVLIQTGGVFTKCVGTLISRSFVLTSAKCVEGIKTDNITMFFGQVRMGALPLCSDPRRCQQVRAAQVLIHPNRKGKNFNVALIKTEVPVIETDFIQPICLPLNVTVEDTSKANYEDFRPRVQIGRSEMKIACGYTGVPIVVRDRDQRYNIVGLANGGCAPTIQSDATPLQEYMDWIMTTLLTGEMYQPTDPAVNLKDYVPKKCGEEPTKDGFVKWNVFIQTGHFYRKCVGTLISRSFVLTSGRCLEGVSADSITMFLGQVHMDALPLCLDTNRCQKACAERVWEHKPFNVALIKMQLPAIESEAIQPVCLLLNVTVEDVWQGNEQVLQPRIPVGSDQTEIACAKWGVPMVVKDTANRYNIARLASQNCDPIEVQREPEPIQEYMAWIINILPYGEKELPMSNQASS